MDANRFLKEMTDLRQELMNYAFSLDQIAGKDDRMVFYELNKAQSKAIEYCCERMGYIIKEHSPME